jgi:hypothetical protein
MLLGVQGRALNGERSEVGAACCGQEVAMQSGSNFARALLIFHLFEVEYSNFRTSCSSFIPLVSVNRKISKMRICCQPC